MTPDSKLTKKHLTTRLKRTEPSHSKDALNMLTQEKENLDRLALLRAVLDTICEPIYIVDLESDEIIFANKKVGQLYGSTVGRRCWESLQKGVSTRCSFCTNNHLLDNDGRPTGIYQSRYKNTLTGRWYQCSDQAFEWIDGRIVAIKTSVDVTSLVESLSSAEELYKENSILSKKIAVSRTQERKQLSQKLHDELGSIGTAIKLNSEFLQTQIPIEMNKEKSAAEDLVTLSQKFLETVRKISNDLNPYTAISHMTVTKMLEELFNEWLSRNRTIHGYLDLDLDSKYKEVLYKSLQESLTNVSRHSSATQVKVSCHVSKITSEPTKGIKTANVHTHLLEFRVSDNGKGFPDDSIDTGLGLLYMKEGVQSLGGKLTLGQSKKGGAGIFIQLPFNR